MFEFNFRIEDELVIEPVPCVKNCTKEIQLRSAIDRCSRLIRPRKVLVKHFSVPCERDAALLTIHSGRRWAQAQTFCASFSHLDLRFAAPQSLHFGGQNIQLPLYLFYAGLL